MWVAKTEQARQQAPEVGERRRWKGRRVGPKERDGKVKANVIERTDTATLEGFVVGNVEAGVSVFTDDHRGYRGLSASFVDQLVKHCVGEYVNEIAHTNGIESLWAMLKRGYKGAYHKISAKHVVRYAFAGRHNLCDLDAIVQMTMIAKGLDGKRLRYDDLVAAS
jgi:hypothetical protein